MKIIKYILIGLSLAIAVFLAFGIPTSLIPTGLFKRMFAPSWLDYTFLFLISALIGAYFAIHFYQKDKFKKVKSKSGGVACGATLGFFGIICPICSVILVSLFGTAFLLSYFKPIQPFLGLASIILLSVLLYFKVKNPCNEANN